MSPAITNHPGQAANAQTTEHPRMRPLRAPDFLHDAGVPLSSRPPDLTGGRSPASVQGELIAAQPKMGNLGSVSPDLL